MIWIPNEHSSTWIALSRASENSSRTDADIRVNEDPQMGTDGNITLISHFGKPHLLPENVTAFELGSRLQANRAIGVDLATFYNQYTNRHTNEPRVSYWEDEPLPRHLVLPTDVESNISGETHGLELLCKVHPVSIWDISGSYTLFEIHLHQSASSLDFATSKESEGSSPRNEFQVHSLLNLRRNLEFDSDVYYVGPLMGPGIKAYTRLDLRAGWRPHPGFEISAGGRNLLDADHYEFGSGDQVLAEPVTRSAYVNGTWRF